MYKIVAVKYVHNTRNYTITYNTGYKCSVSVLRANSDVLNFIHKAWDSYMDGFHNCIEKEPNTKNITYKLC